MQLEDDAWDLVGKAMRGLRLTPATLAEATGLDSTHLSSWLRSGEPTLPENDYQQLARVLDLSAPALINHANYPSPPELPPEAHRFVTPFGHLGVNSWCVSTPDQQILFDAGSDGPALLALLQIGKLTPDILVITHGHGDHTAGIDTLCKAFPALRVAGPAGSGADQLLRTGDEIAGFTAHDVDGHWPGALAYHKDHLCIVGDALFAGSIGKIPAERYPAGLRLIRSLLHKLPAETLLLPGHGPHSTVSIELHHNPALANH